MKVNLLLFFFITLGLNLSAQSQLDSVCFTKKIIDYSIDPMGNLFLSFERGEITKFSPTLDSLSTYTPSKIGNTKLLESGSGLVIFAFYDFFQEYVLTDKFLSNPTLSKFSNASIDYIDLATQSLDNNIWLLDNTRFRLIKLNPLINKVEVETALSTVLDSSINNFTFIKEHHNKIFLVNENRGIYVFDNLGNFLKKITAKTSKCSFSNSNILYIERDQIVSAGLYSNKETRKPSPISFPVGVMKYMNSTYITSSTCLYRSY